MSGISLDRVRSTATADLGFAAELLYAVPLKVDGAKIANADFRLRGVRDNLATANSVAAATLADGLEQDHAEHAFSSVAVIFCGGSPGEG